MYRERLHRLGVHEYIPHFDREVVPGYQVAPAVAKPYVWYGRDDLGEERPITRIFWFFKHWEGRFQGRMRVILSYHNLLALFGWYQQCTRGVTGKFFWGGKVIFPDFFFRCEMSFSGKNLISILVDPKQILVVLRSEKAKVLSSFCNLSIFHFQFSTFPFTILLLFLISTPFPLPLFSW